MSVGSDSPSGSQYLSSSHASLNQSKKASTEISKIYKNASQLYLTRRLAEAYELLQPVITPPLNAQGHDQDCSEPAPLAPIAVAATSQRIKIWSLYVTLLSAVMDLGSDEGREEFGSKEYNSIVRQVQNGDVWEQVVRDGYQGREDSVDAEVVYNLSNLLLAQAQSQLVNQSRLETYLASSSGPALDLSTHLNNSINGKRSHMSGASTPKDLSSRIKILELFTLHVLPRNDEWEYAKSFINNSDVLDEERKEAFLQTIQELQDAKEHGSAAYTEDEFGDGDYIDNRDERNGTADHDRSNASHRRTGSEVDYGIDESLPRPNGTKMKSVPPDHEPDVDSYSNPSTTKAISPPPPASRPTSISSPSKPDTERTKAMSPKRIPSPPPARRPQPTKPSRPKSNSPNKSHSNIIHQAKHIVLLFKTISMNISSSLTKNPTVLFRTLMFLVAFLAMISRREIRERIRRIVDASFDKVKKTIGMGVKVSYI